MKKSFFKLKSILLLNLFVFTFSSNLFAQFPNPPALQCNDSYPMSPGLVRFTASNQSASNLTNAISIIPTETTIYLENISFPGEPVTGYWVTTKVYTVTIPFYDNQLRGKLQISTDTSCNYPANYPNTNNVSNWWVSGTIKVNGNMAQIGISNYATGDLSVGVHNYVVESICTGGVGVYSTYSQTCNTQNIRVVVNRMPIPAFNLTTTAFCRKDNSNLFTGDIGFKFTGTYTNVDNRFFLNFSHVNPANNYTVPLISIGSTNVANGANTYSSAAFGLYNVKMKFVYTNIIGNSISYFIPTGDYGWNNYSYNKTFTACINKTIAEPVKITEKSMTPITDPNNDPEARRKQKKFMYFPNPVNDILTIKTSDNVKIKTIKIFTNDDLLVSNKTVSSDSDFQEMDISKLKSGLYFLEVETTEGTSIEKIIKN